MNPLVMLLILVGLWGAFAYSAHKRWRLMQVGGPTLEPRFDAIGKRLETLWTFAIFQKKMRYYFVAGLAHQLIFVGFCALLLRSIVLWGRGFSPDFNLWVLGPEGFLGLPLGAIYEFIKDVCASMVVLGASVFVYYRVINPQRRMTLKTEGLVILGITISMMLADILYDGASIVLNATQATACAEAANWCDAIQTLIAPLAPETELHWEAFPRPAGTAAALLLEGAAPSTLVVLAHMGYWVHTTLVLVLLNILPYSKHFHIITAIPNVFTADLTPPGRLRPIAAGTEQLMSLVEKATEEDDVSRAPIGYARIEHFTWKDVLDFYTCTECGRCTDNCPAALTGKKLSPKHLTLALRDHLYTRQEEFAALNPEILRWNPETKAAEAIENAGGTKGAATPAQTPVYAPKNLLPDVVDPDVIWACTTCRACEEQCPVMITYVDKIVQMRRHEVLIKGDGFPSELSKPFEGMETNGNPWSLSRMDRANWAEGLDIPMAAEKPTAEVFYWVGCAASYDDRAKKVARATAQLLKQAGIDFAILGEEESCTGDPARRAGNEYLFTMLAETNIATLNGYREQGGAKTILTTCPHCFNTLLNEYPDFGGKYNVVHHTDYILSLLSAKKLVPVRGVKAKVTYHDSCYLGRYNEIYEPPREILRRIDGVELIEPETSRAKGLCCGAGGAQMFMEEQNTDRVNVKRTKQLLATGPDIISSACPFCMTMLTDGLKAEDSPKPVRQLDVVELLLEACAPETAAAAE